jgi:hydrogenase nickel incorporation protein HypA/HybF
MHEMSLMNSLMNKIFELSDKNNCKKVKKVSVWIGALSHMSKSHFKEHFDRASKGTLAENAELDITLSEDINHPNAQNILLESIDVED